MKQQITVFTVLFMFTAVALGSSSYAEEGRRRKLRRAPQGSSKIVIQDFGIGAIFESERSMGFSRGVSMTFGAGEKGAIQTYFSIPTTSPFNFGMGGNYKYTLTGMQTMGMHVGGGIGLGSSNSGNGGKFFFMFNGIAGIHFALPGTKDVLFHVDAGPSFLINDGAFSFHAEVLQIGVHLLI